MEIIYIFFALVLGTILWFVMKPKKIKDNLNIPTVPPLYSEPHEIITIDDPVEADPEPIIIGEMPIKPIPVDCQYAIFRPAPEMYSYTDCCGELQQGEGYQPWEKRTPVPLDASKEFTGMDLLGEEAQVDC